MTNTNTVTKQEVIDIVGQATQEILEAMHIYSIDVQRQFDEIKVDIAQLKADVAQLKSDVIEIKSDLILIHKELDGIHVELDGIHKELDEIRQRLSGLEANHADDRIASIREVNGLRLRIEVLEKTVKQLTQARS